MSVFTFHNSSPLPSSPPCISCCANYPSSIRLRIPRSGQRERVDRSIVDVSSFLRSLIVVLLPSPRLWTSFLPSFLLCSFFGGENQKTKKKKTERPRTTRRVQYDITEDRLREATPRPRSQSIRGNGVARVDAPLQTCLLSIFALTDLLFSVSNVNISRISFSSRLY